MTDCLTDCLGDIPRLNLCFSQGSDQEVVLTFTPQNPLDPPVDFTGAVAAAYFRTSTSATTFNQFTVRIDDGLLDTNQIALGLSSSLMESLEPRAYEYDLKIVFVTGKNWTPLRGTLTLIANTTRGAIL
jgi:hypothetical protein